MRLGLATTRSAVAVVNEASNVRYDDAIIAVCERIVQNSELREPLGILHDAGWAQPRAHGEQVQLALNTPSASPDEEVPAPAPGLGPRRRDAQAAVLPDRVRRVILALDLRPFQRPTSRRFVTYREGHPRRVEGEATIPCSPGHPFWSAA